MRLTENFYREEFDCRNGIVVPDALLPNVQKLAENLQVLRDTIGEPIHINSGYRTKEYNKKVGGVPSSQHILGKAADITAKSFTPKRLATLVETLIREKKLWFGGLGIYPGFIHVDIRKNKARW